MIFCICLSILKQTETNIALNKCLHYLVIGSHHSGMFVQYYLYFKMVEFSDNIPYRTCITFRCEFTDGQCTCEENGNIYEANSEASCLTFQHSTSVLPAVTQHCQPGTAFDISICVCNYIADVTCPAGCGVPTTTPATTISTTTTTPATTTEPGMNKFNKMKFQVSNLTVIQSYYTYAGNN